MDAAGSAPLRSTEWDRSLSTKGGCPVAAEVPFSVVLELLEAHGWKLQRIVPPYRVFTRGRELPILIPVQDKMVSTVYVDKIEKILRAAGENEEGP